ncbi:MAG: cyclodeaminase/cyclohydrolase family protein [Candidatus Omnitrophica bacterium]|nr:cyclodeaminase/cyclohydrolase family protein [Candidatus Omnitrophota bacterium]HOX53892.1 cyclodeaminase/cyclohydrolase family protein [Candidatus Omnitrophota bacterium]
MYKNKSVKIYLDDLSAKKPAPGGGSAAALAGALGAALLSMVANFTVGKEKYRQFEQEIKSSLSKSEKIRKKLLELVDLDVITYTKVAKSKKKSLALYQKSLKEAANVPLEITKNCIEALELCPILEAKGNKYLVSDVHVARQLLVAAVHSAVVNVRINLPYIEDKEFVHRVDQQLRSWRV